MNKIEQLEKEIRRIVETEHATENELFAKDKCDLNALGMAWRGTAFRQVLLLIESLEKECDKE